MSRGRGRAALLIGLTALVGSAVSALPARADAPAPSTAFDKAVAGLDAKEGLLPVYLDAKAGRVLLRLKSDSSGSCGEYLYQVALRSGLGSTPVGLDRSNPGSTRLLAFRRAGARVVAELENSAFRAEEGSLDEVQAVRESFPPSIIWAGDIQAVGADGSLLVDFTSFLARDAFGVVDALKAAKQGDFSLSPERSYVDVQGVLAFPENLEFEAHETFVSPAPGDEVRGLAPDAHAVTLIEHQSLIKLPPPGFTPRLADPRTGAFSAVVTNFAAPLGSPLVYRLAARFRLEKTDPSAARSTVKKPIVFYVDRAAPEPIRGALLDGARWWAQAFDAAGFVDAFKVEVLPEGVNPLDARYNVINWVHRQTRGWSYGDPITDPRTGEIIKGSVLLGSQRVRQDRLIFEGLAGADKTGTGGPNDPVVISLARLRQLAVHETGHALGLEHNFAASTYGDRASVMDYPPPRVNIVDGKLDFSDAYKVGLGDWDRFAINWLYAEVPSGVAGQAALEHIVRDGYGRGLRYVRDEDARPLGSANPFGAMWDDGPDAVEGLRHVLAVRAIALADFGPRVLPAGAPLSDLRRLIVPVYLFHRYEVEAAAKSIGGVDFNYGVAGDGLPPPRVVDGAAQRRALAAILDTLDPSVLDLPDGLIDQLSTGRDGATDRQYETELFSDSQTPIFDLTRAARAAVDVALDSLLEPSRLKRVADQGARDAAGLTLPELLNQTVDRALAAPASSARRRELARAVRGRLAVKLAGLIQDDPASPRLAADARAALERFGHRLATWRDGDAEDSAQAQYLSALIFNSSPEALAALVKSDRAIGIQPPPGMPIGADGADDGWFSEGIGVAP